MTSFTFSVAQVRSAPAGVRQWIENQVAADVLAPNRAHSQPSPAHAANLAACTLDEGVRIFEAIRDDVAATRVFLELAREAPVGVNTQPLHALSIGEIMRHTQLNDSRLGDCFRAINQAFQQIRNNPEAALFGFDQANHVYIHETTHRSIRALWEELIQLRAPAMVQPTIPVASSPIGVTPPYVAPEMATRASAPLTASIQPPAARSAAPAPAAAGTPTPGVCPGPSMPPAEVESAAPPKAPVGASSHPHSTGSAGPTPGAAQTLPHPPKEKPPAIKASAPRRPSAPAHSALSGRAEAPPAKPAADPGGRLGSHRQSEHHAAAVRIFSPIVANAAVARSASGAAVGDKRKPRSERIGRPARQSASSPEVAATKPPPKRRRRKT